MTDSRFPRSARLTDARAFKRVFERSTRSADAYFTVLAAPRHDGPARLGLAISKKQARRALDRNRLKRLVRETFRRHRTLLAGLDLVVMARAAAVGADNRRLADSLRRHFRRIAAPEGNAGGQ